MAKRSERLNNTTEKAKYVYNNNEIHIEEDECLTATMAWLPGTSFKMILCNKNAIKKMKKGKAIGPDEISTEMIQALGEYGTELLHKVFNEIYETGVLPEDLTKSIFITLPKQPGAIDCELHRTISIMSHLVKILLRVVIERIRNKLLPEISEVQYGYRKDKSTINAILVLRMLGERAIEHQQDVFICFIDYSKAFDKVQHTKLITLLEQINIDDKDLRIIKNLYWNQTAAVKVGDELSEWKSIKRGVRQGCVMSPDLFNLYSEHILRQLEDLPGISLGGNNINNIRFADDTALIAASEKKLQALLDKVVECSDKMGLTINVKKTKSMTISKKKQPPNCKLTIGQKSIEQKDTFNYLGNFLTADGKSKTAIRTRIAMAKNKFQSMKQILTNRNLSNQLKIRLLKCYIWPVLMYGCETWTITPGLKGNIEAAEMWFLRRMFKISYRDRVSNIRVLERAKTTRELLNCIQKRQLTFLGHSIRRGKLECLALEGRLEGKRSRGRQRTKFLDIMANSFEASGVTITVPEMLHCAYDRDASKTRLVKALKERGTYDFDYLEEQVGDKSKEEIKIFLHNRRFFVRNTIAQSKEAETLLQDKPIDLWMKSIPNKNLFSDLIPEVFEKYVKKRKFSSQPNEPNFERIYEYIVICLNGGILPVLSPQDSFIVLMLMQRLKKKLPFRKDIANYLSDMTANSSNNNGNVEQEDQSTQNVTTSIVSPSSEVQPRDLSSNNENCDASSSLNVKNDAGAANSSVSNDEDRLNKDKWDHLVFTQLWPGSECYYDSVHSMNSVNSVRRDCEIPEDVKVWTIHGLWPSLGTSRSNPSYCNESWSFSDGPIQSILSNMKLKWPNYFADEPVDSLWKHEWVKHGTCAANMPETRGELNYFSKGLELVDKYNMFTILKKSGINPDDNNTIRPISDKTKFIFKLRGGMIEFDKLEVVSKDIQNDRYFQEVVRMSNIGRDDDVKKAVRKELGASPTLVCIRKTSLGHSTEGLQIGKLSQN
ncbi:Ribonuclease Oy [Nymphon striatum]|nr:Ribonuclease Oy [Nymphon striatum]